MRDVLLKFILDQSRSALGQFVRAWLCTTAGLSLLVGAGTYIHNINHVTLAGLLFGSVFWGCIVASLIAMPVAIGLAILFVAIKF